jgi:hypothetical protein
VQICLKCVHNTWHLLFPCCALSNKIYINTCEAAPPILYEICTLCINHYIVNNSGVKMHDYRSSWRIQIEARELTVALSITDKGNRSGQYKLRVTHSVSEVVWTLASEDTSVYKVHQCQRYKLLALSFAEVISSERYAFIHYSLICERQWRTEALILALLDMLLKDERSWKMPSDSSLMLSHNSG